MATTQIDLTHAPPRAAAEPAAVPRAAWLGFLVVLVAAVMDLLDATIAQTAAPAIQASLNGTYADLEWITAAYVLALSVMLLIGGRLGDLVGRKRLLLWGMAGFTGASVLCALAPTIEALIAARILQGALGALMLPQCFGLIRELFGDQGQAKAFAVFGPVMGLAALVGPVAGGALVDLDLLGTGWRAIFLVNVPVGIAAILLGRRVLPDVPPSAAGARIDAVSVGLGMLGAGAVVYPLIQGREQDWPAWMAVLGALGVVALAAFGRRQLALARAGRSPLVEPSVLERRAYVAGLAFVVCFIGAMGGMLLAFTVMYQAGLGFSPLESGVATLAIPAAAIGGSILSSVLVGRLGRTVLHLGAGTMATGLLLTVVVLREQGGGLSAWDLAGPLTITGLGMGMVFMPLFDVILAGVGPEQLGSASGLLESVQQLSMALGIAVVGTVLFGVVGEARDAATFVDAAATSLLVCVGFLGLALLVAFRLPRHAREEG